MSREIKFRVWDKILEEYQYITLSDLGEDDYYWFDGETSLWFVLYDSAHEQERFIIEQYTGLKDKNGKEIYINVIFCLRDYKEFIIDSIYSSYYKFEIIGNIQENKEMLK